LGRFFGAACEVREGERESICIPALRHHGSQEGTQEEEQVEETALVPHRTPDLSSLLERAQSGDSAVAVRAYLDAGGSIDVLVHGAPGVRQLPLLHHMILDNCHPHNELAECLRLLIEAGADINANLGTRVAITPTLAASEKKCCCKVLQACLQLGGDVLATRSDGITALHQAAAAGRTDGCELLLARESSLVHIRDANGFTALMHAVAYGTLDTVKLFRQHGADLGTVSSYGTTLLMAACLYKRSDMASVLIAAGADVNAVDYRQGQSALMIAAEKNSSALVQLLLHHGADTSVTDGKGQDALFVAASAGHVRMLELLVQRGLSTTTVDCRGCTLLMIAAERGHEPAAEWLLQQGAAVNAVNVDGATALHYASMHSSDDAAMIELLLANGADVHKRANSGRTALDVAAFRGHIDCARVLIAAGADVNCAHSNGVTSLHLAVTSHHTAVAQLLLQHGAAELVNNIVLAQCPASNECCCTGLTALMMCTEADTVKLLLAAGADVHATTAAGDTCLHLTARHKLSAAVLCLLIKAGADIDAVNADGKTAAQVANDEGCTLIEQLLIRAAQQAGH
jgi:ankyrin repeat protein